METVKIPCMKINLGFNWLELKQAGKKSILEINLGMSKVRFCCYDIIYLLHIQCMHIKTKEKIAEVYKQSYEASSMKK